MHNKSIKYDTLMRMISEELTDKHGRNFVITSFREFDGFYNSKVGKYDTNSVLVHYVICDEELSKDEDRMEMIVKLIKSYNKAISDIKDDNKKRIRLQAMLEMAIEILTGEFVYCYTDRRSFGKIYESGKPNKKVSSNEIKDNFTYISQSLSNSIKQKLEEKEPSVVMNLLKKHNEN